MSPSCHCRTCKKTIKNISNSIIFSFYYVRFGNMKPPLFQEGCVYKTTNVRDTKKVSFFILLTQKLLNNRESWQVPLWGRPFNSSFYNNNGGKPFLFGDNCTFYTQSNENDVLEFPYRKWRTASQWWIRVVMCSPEVTSQTRTVESEEPDIMTRSSYCKHNTDPVWPVRTRWQAKLWRSHILMVLSLKPETIFWSSYWRQ